MATQTVSVLRTSQQPGVTAHREWCSVDPMTLAAIGRQVGHQVRIRRGDTEFALYTVAESHAQEPPGTVRMSQAGRERLGTSDEFDGVIDPQGPDPALTDAGAHAAGELVERLCDGGGRLIAIAPHGGDIEEITDDQAERVRAELAAEGASSWLCRGWRPGGGALLRWHITSADLAPECFPELRTVMGRDFAHVVAFHGYSGAEVLVGGAAPVELREEIAAAVRLATAGSGIVVRLATPDDLLGGDDPRNVVNRLAAGGGVQLEQSLAARHDHGLAIASAVAGVFRGR